MAEEAIDRKATLKQESTERSASDLSATLWFVFL